MLATATEDAALYPEPESLCVVAMFRGGGIHTEQRGGSVCVYLRAELGRAAACCRPTDRALRSTADGCDVRHADEGTRGVLRGGGGATGGQREVEWFGPVWAVEGACLERLGGSACNAVYVAVTCDHNGSVWGFPDRPWHVVAF